jgi:hypothetical protein
MNSCTATWHLASALQWRKNYGLATAHNSFPRSCVAPSDRQWRAITVQCMPDCCHAIIIIALMAFGAASGICCLPR